MSLVLALCAIVCAGFGGSYVACDLLTSQARITRRSKHTRANNIKLTDQNTFACSGFSAAVLAYACGIERDSRLTGNTERINNNDHKQVDKGLHTLDETLRTAGLHTRLSAASFRSARIHLALAGTVAGAALGFVISPEWGVVLSGLGLVLGFQSISKAIKTERTERLRALDKELPEMLEVLALGLRSGLSFDRSFTLYHSHFQTKLACECAAAQRRWSLGLGTREGELRALASLYDSQLLFHAIESIIRSVRFGTHLVDPLESAASEARSIRRAKREELIAKAPVKMMLPTGTLILPAMLLVVLGPVALELIEGL